MEIDVPDIYQKRESRIGRSQVVMQLDKAQANFGRYSRENVVHQFYQMGPKGPNLSILALLSHWMHDCLRKCEFRRGQSLQPGQTLKKLRAEVCLLIAFLSQAAHPFLKLDLDWHILIWTSFQPLCYLDLLHIFWGSISFRVSLNISC